MIISYTHEDGTVEEVSTDDLSAVESAAVESVTDLEWDDVERALKSQRPGAMRAVLWVHRKRSQPTLRFNAFDVPAWKRRLKARLEREEILDLVETLRKDASTETDAGFDEMLGYMRTLAHDPADVDWAVAETGPKALAPVTAVADLPLEESAAAS